MNTIQRPYSLYEEHPVVEPTSAYDLIRQLEESLKKEGDLDDHEVCTPENPFNHFFSDLTQNIPSLENSRNQIRDEIFSLKRIASEFNAAQAQKFAANEHRQSLDLAELRRQKEVLKTQQSCKETFAEINRAHQERMSQLQRQIEQLKENRVEHEIAISTPLIVSAERDVTQASREELNEQQARISELRRQIFELEQMKARKINSHEVLTHQLAALKETDRSLEAKQKYYREQIAIYSDKMSRKKALRNKTKTDYQEMSSAVNRLVEMKKKYLKEVATEIEKNKKHQLKEIEKIFSAEKEKNEKMLNESITKIHRLNETALENTEEKLKSNYENKKAERERLTEGEKEVLDEYWRYVNDGVFRIRNVFKEEYLYASDFTSRNNSRERIVFTWGRKNEAVSQSEWKLIQDSESGTFRLFNLYYGNYLYVGREIYFPDHRGKIFTRQPGDQLDEQKWESKNRLSKIWQITPRGGDTYRISNIENKREMYAGEDYEIDRETHPARRREVFASNHFKVKSFDWQIIKIS